RRLPVRWSPERVASPAKIAAYEAASGAGWAGRAVMLADATDRGADFAADSERIAGQVPASYNLDRIYLSTTPLSAARSQLLSEIAGGVALINYMGHGALDRL